MAKAKLVGSTKIYKDVTELLNSIINVAPYFPKGVKYTIGGRMQDLSLDLLCCVTKTYIDKELSTKVDTLTEFQCKFVVLQTLLRIALEKKWIEGNGRQIHFIELIASIGKQSTAWKNSLVNAMEKSES